MGQFPLNAKCEGGAFCRAVDMEQTRRRSMHTHFPYPFGIRHFASEEQILEGQKRTGTFSGDLIEYGRGQEQGCYPLLPQERTEF